MSMDPHFKAMVDAAAAAAPPQGGPPLAAIPPAMIRAGYQMQRKAQNTRLPEGVTARDLTIPGPGGPIPARLYTPAGAPAAGPGLVYFHGGGFVIGDLETHDGHCRRMAAYSGARVLAVDYRLAPEHPFPAGHDDALAATKWAFDHAADIGFDPAHIGVGGDSAGGNLAGSVSNSLRGDAARKLTFQLLLYPGLWPAEHTQSRKDRDGPILSHAALDYFEVSLAADGHPEAHRAYLLRAEDLTGLPETLIVTAGFDPLEDEGRAYAKAIEAAGGKATLLHYPAMVHDFFIMGDVSPAVEEAAQEISAALKAHL